MAGLFACLFVFLRPWHCLDDYARLQENGEKYTSCKHKTPFQQITGVKIIFHSFSAGRLLNSVGLVAMAHFTQGCCPLEDYEQNFNTWVLNLYLGLQNKHSESG